VISEKNIVILLAALRVPHEAHGTRFRAKVLDYPYMLFHKIISQFLGEGEILA